MDWSLQIHFNAMLSVLNHALFSKWRWDYKNGRAWRDRAVMRNLAGLIAHSCSVTGGEGNSHVSRGFSFKTRCDAESNGHEQDEGRKQEEGDGRRWFRNLNWCRAYLAIRAKLWKAIQALLFEWSTCLKKKGTDLRYIWCQHKQGKLLVAMFAETGKLAISHYLFATSFYFS